MEQLEGKYGLDSLSLLHTLHAVPVSAVTAVEDFAEKGCAAASRQTSYLQC